MTNGNYNSSYLFYTRSVSVIQTGYSIAMQRHQGDNTTDQEKFIGYIGAHYNDIKDKLQMLCRKNGQPFSEDSYHDVILKCHKAIKKKGKLKDSSAYGMESYLIRSYMNHEIDLKRVANVAKRDLNYNSDNITELHEKWYNDNHSDAREKIKSDMYKDFSCLFIMSKVEDNFDQEHFYLFRIKELVPGMTYKKLSERTNLKGVRQKVVEVKKWLQQNVTKEDINNAFQKMYGDLC